MLLEERNELGQPLERVLVLIRLRLLLQLEQQLEDLLLARGRILDVPLEQSRLQCVQFHAVKSVPDVLGPGLLVTHDVDELVGRGGPLGLLCARQLRAWPSCFNHLLFKFFERKNKIYKLNHNSNL